jgi:hypothetical protein
MQARAAKLAWLQQAIQEGIDSGSGEPWEGAAEIIRQARARRGAIA